MPSTLGTMKNLKLLASHVYSQDEIDNLKHYFLISQQKDDDGGFHVWQVPPIKPGQRIGIKTYGSDPK